MPAAEPAASLPRRLVRRVRRELAGWRRTTIRRPMPGAEPRQLRGQRLRLVLPDAAALVRVAAGGWLTGQICQLDLHLAAAPESQLTGLRPPRLGRGAVGFSWRRRGHRLRVVLRWTRPYDVGRALEDVLRAVLRSRPWDQLSGPVYALDAAAWRDGRSSWPQGRLVATPTAPVAPVAPSEPAEPEVDELGRPLGPYLAGPPAPAASLALPAPVVTALANPYGRTLVGTATPYQLARDTGRVVLRDGAGSVVWHATPAAADPAGGALVKYAVVEVDQPVAGDPVAAAAVRTLAACGMVFAAPDPAVRASLDALGLVTVADAAAVADLAGYAYSVEAARRMAVTGDAALRRTTLGGGDGAVPLPGVTAVVSTKRAEHLPTLLGYLAAQTYPALEAVIGLHGYDLPAATRRELVDSLPFPVRIMACPAEQTLGQVLGRLSRRSDGELVTKLDDDDHYGPNHVTDLFLAWHTSGADLVAKGARFVHFPERDETIDRRWAAPEVFDVTPAGGTMLLSRGTLAQVGGWSHSSRHVDADLLARIRTTGGLVYRTHALEYVYVRRSDGHTFVTGVGELLAHGERTYPGLPSEIVHPGAVPRAPHVPV